MIQPMMEYRRLGRTGLKVSRVLLGCGNFGGVGSAPEFFGMGETPKQAFRLMDEALEMGINLFDTADAYGGGRSEEMIGLWLKGKSSPVRDRILVSSKAFNPVADGPNDRGLSRRHLRRQVERSLGRLGVERLDAFLIHEPDPDTPLEETLGVLDDLIREGKIHYIGASNLEAWRMMRSLWVSDKNGLHRFHWMQSSYSLLDRRPERALFPVCRNQGLGFTPFSPLAGGWLSGKYRAGEQYPEGSRMTLRPEPYLHLVRERIFQGLEKLAQEAGRRGVETAALALAWVLAQPCVTAAIVGPRRPSHFVAVRQALEISLSEEEKQQIAGFFEE